MSTVMATCPLHGTHGAACGVISTRRGHSDRGTSLRLRWPAGLLLRTASPVKRVLITRCSSRVEEAEREDLSKKKRSVLGRMLETLLSAWIRTQLDEECSDLQLSITGRNRDFLRGKVCTTTEGISISECARFYRIEGGRRGRKVALVLKF